MNNQPISLQMTINKLKSTQSGVVLIISLVMLLLLTLIGTTSMQTTTLEEKMVGNMRDQNIAFQTAEAVLRAGEAATAPVVPAPVFTCAGTGGYYDGSTIDGVNPSCPQPPDWKTIDWTDPNVVATNTVGGVSYSYYIEQLDPTSSGDDSDCIQAGTPCSALGLLTKWYRITARGTGNTSSSTVLLQSTYTRQ